MRRAAPRRTAAAQRPGAAAGRAAVSRTLGTWSARSGSRARARSEAALGTLLRSEKTAASGVKGEERGGRAGAPASHASTAQRPQWYCARTAVGTAGEAAAALALASASKASALLHWKTACAARRWLGRGPRGAGLPRGIAAPAAVWVRTRRAGRQRCRCLGCSPPAPPTTWPRARGQAVHVARRVPAATRVVSASAAASARAQPADRGARAPRAHLSAASRMAVRRVGGRPHDEGALEHGAERQRYVHHPGRAHVLTAPLQPG